MLYIYLYLSIYLSIYVYTYLYGYIYTCGRGADDGIQRVVLVAEIPAILGLRV